MFENSKIFDWSTHNKNTEPLKISNLKSVFTDDNP